MSGDVTGSSVTGAWVEHAFLPHAKYRVVEQEHGWSVQVWDDQQPASTTSASGDSPQAER